MEPPEARNRPRKRPEWWPKTGGFRGFIDGDVRVGDVLRITTAVFNVPGVVDVTAWLNPPKSTNCKAFFNCEQKSFDKVMSAIQSHVVPVDTPDGPMTIGEVGLVLERPAKK